MLDLWTSMESADRTLAHGRRRGTRWSWRRLWRAGVGILSLVLAAQLYPATAVAAPAGWACYSTYNQACVSQFGYTGQSTWGYPVDAWGNNCTNYAAYRLANNNSSNNNPGNLGNADQWAVNARNKGFAVNQTTAVGAIAQWNSTHVAYIDWVSSDGNQIAVSETSYGGTVNGKTYTSSSGRRVLTRGASGWPDNIIHFKDLSGGIGNGAFLRATDNGEIYRVAGGAPLYVSSWTPFGGSQPLVDVTRAQLNAMPQYPADGTFVSGQTSGRVYRFAGGAQHYVSTWSSFGGGQPTVGVDDFTLDRPDGASPLNHVHKYPADGTFISNTADGRVYRVAGGAPLYVSSWDHLGGAQPTTSLDPWDFANYGNLRPVPAPMFLRGLPSTRIFRVVAGGHPYYVPSWTPYGGTQPFLDVDDWAIDGCDHLDCGPFGSADSVTGGPGTVKVTGWSIDPNVATSTRVHVYVGGPAGSTAAVGFDAGVANLTRTDVGSVYPGTGTTHGYDLTVYTTKRGSQPVFVYGINAPGTVGGNDLLGQGTATITEPAKLVSLSPSRVLDTRTGVGAPKGLVGGGKAVDLVVAGRGGVPSSGVAAVVLNVTATATTGAGFVTVFPTGTTRPTASSLNFAKAQTIANQVIAKVGAGGKVSLYTSAGAQLVADVAGYYPNGAGYVGLSPTRILDTRSGVGAAKAKVAGKGIVALTVTGVASVPAGAAAVVLNVTVTAPAGAGYVTAYPGGASRPTASNVSYLAGQTIAGMVIAKVGTGGKVNLYTLASAHLVADVVGWVPAGADYTALSPARVLDTRTGLGAPTSAVAGGHAITLKVTGHGGVPASGVKAVLVNVTVTGPAGAGYVTIYPGSTRPTASNLNYARGDTIANSVIAKVAPDGTITLYTSATTHLVTDINGYWTS
ncbi:MAG: CHAP domain-containing protein [Actinomycetota bacterium]